MAVDIQVNNAAIIIESTDDIALVVNNAAIEVEYTDDQQIVIMNAAIMVESRIEVDPADTYHTMFSDEVELVRPGMRFGDSGLITYGNFCAAEKVYLTRADEPGTSIVDAITLGCWCWFDAESTDAETGLMSKWYTTGNKRSYVLYKNSDNDFVFSISNDGTNVTTVDDNAVNYDDSKWFFVVGRLTPDDQLAVFVNGTWYTNVTDIPNDIYDSDEALDFGRYNRTNYLDGRMCHAFLCAYAVSNTMIEALYAHSKAMFMVR